MGAQGAGLGGTTALGSMLREGLTAMAASEERSGANMAASPGLSGAREFQAEAAAQSAKAVG